VPRAPSGATAHAYDPFLPQGIEGLARAMGYTFIALQGFDLIAAIGGEVRDPRRNLPRAIYLSLGLALAIYRQPRARPRRRSSRSPSQ
jgi:APA family basic amino acid/polyamine antiporter